MTDEQVCETVEKYGANQEECARLNASLSCLRNVHLSGEQAGRLPQGLQVPVPAAAGLDETESTLGGKCHRRAEERGAWDSKVVSAASGNLAPKETFGGCGTFGSGKLGSRY